MDSRTRSRRASALVAALVAAGLGSCATVQRDVLYDVPSGEDPAELSSIEEELVLARASGVGADVQATRRRLAALAAAPSSDSRRQAQVLSLSAEAALLSGDRAAATRLLERSREAYRGDELAAVVGSRLAKGPDERLAALQAASGLSDGGPRLRAELGSALLALGRAREALAAFDAALPYLGDGYGLLYGEERERALALRDAGAEPSSGSSAYLTRLPITLSGMAALAQEETSALDRITGGATWAVGVLYERLKAASWYADPAAPPSAPATRKDAALFLWRLMTRDDPRLSSRYTTRYASRGTSPVPDVPYGSPYFDAALGVVEEGVMSLVDGRSFDPDGPASGLEYYGWLRLAAGWR